MAQTLDRITTTTHRRVRPDLDNAALLPAELPDLDSRSIHAPLSIAFADCLPYFQQYLAPLRRGEDNELPAQGRVHHLEVFARLEPRS